MKIRDIGVGRGSQVVVGRVAAAHGVTGEVKITPASGNPDDLRPFRRFSFAGGKGDLFGFEVIKCRVVGRSVVVSLAGLASRETAEKLRGFEVLVDRALLPELEPQTWYWHDLAGLKAVTGEGRLLGLVSALFLTRAHQILIITGDRGEYLVPVHEQFMAAPDMTQGILVITPPPGLLEMNE